MTTNSQLPKQRCFHLRRPKLQIIFICSSSLKLNVSPPWFTGMVTSLLCTDKNKERYLKINKASSLAGYSLLLDRLPRSNGTQMRDSEIIRLLYPEADLSRLAETLCKSKRGLCSQTRLYYIGLLKTKTPEGMNSLTIHKKKQRLFFFFFTRTVAYVTAELTNKASFYTFEQKSPQEVCSSVVCFPKQQNSLFPITPSFLPTGQLCLGWLLLLQSWTLATLVPPEWALLQEMVPNLKHLNNNSVRF